MVLTKFNPKSITLGMVQSSVARALLVPDPRPL